MRTLPVSGFVSIFFTASDFWRSARAFSTKSLSLKIGARSLTRPGKKLVIIKSSLLYFENRLHRLHADSDGDGIVEDCRELRANQPEYAEQKQCRIHFYYKSVVRGDFPNQPLRQNARRRHRGKSALAQDDVRGVARD